MEEGVQTLTGRSGVAVSFTQDDDGKEKVQLIFDPKTHEIIGDRLRFEPGHQDGDPAAWADYETVLVQVAVVKSAGLRPDGTRAVTPKN